MIAMDKHWVIPLIKDNIHDGNHDGIGNFDFLGALHVNDNMPDAIQLHESPVVVGNILLDESAKTMSERRVGQL